MAPGTPRWSSRRSWAEFEHVPGALPPQPTGWWMCLSCLTRAFTDPQSPTPTRTYGDNLQPRMRAGSAWAWLSAYAVVAIEVMVAKLAQRVDRTRR